MKLVVVAALVTAIAFIGSRVSFRQLRLPLGVENLFLTGGEFVLVGLVLGSAGFGVLDESILRGLAPFMGLGLSWIGLLFGIQWEFRRLATIPRQVFAMALLQALATFALVSVPFFFLLNMWFDAPSEYAFIGALTLGAAASTTAPGGLALGGRQAPAAVRPLVQLLQTLASLDGFIGVVVFGLVSCLAVLHGGIAWYWWGISSIGLGLTIGLIAVILTAYRLPDDEMLLVLLGVVGFGGGLALYLSLSPLLINLVAGIVVANLSRKRVLDKLRKTLSQGERSIYILLLLLVGAGWRLEWSWVVGLGAVYLITRSLGKTLGGYLAAQAAPVQSRPPGHLGLGLLSHGGMAVAIVVNLHQILRLPLTDAVISVVLTGMLVSELLSPVLVRRLLGRPA